MPRRSRRQGLICKNCGSRFSSQKEVRITKTWHVVSPFPDKNGNITISIFAIWICPVCGSRNRGKLSSIKSDTELKSKSYTQRLEEIIYESREITVEEIAGRLGIPKNTVLKALRYLIKEGIIRAKLEGEKVIAL